MEWFNGGTFGLAYFSQWQIFLPNILNLVVIPFLLCYFFCRFGGISFRLRYGIGYFLISAGLSFLEAGTGLPGSLGLILEILAFALYGTLFLKNSWQEAWINALLLRSVFGIIDCVLKMVDYRLVLPLMVRLEAFFLASDALRELIRILLVLGALTWILQHFFRRMPGILREQILFLTVPLFFIALAERVIQGSFYGDTVTVDKMGGVFPAVEVNHWENLLLQLLAGVCLPAVLFLYQKLAQAQSAEKKLLCLSRQETEQKQYVEEAILREKQTKAFRHDLQNHLTVLQEFLKGGQVEEARKYLDQLQGAARELSCQVQTGNPAVDVLLGSKSAAAKQRGIQVQCELFIPKESSVGDMNWCILLSNAFDNAVNACEEILPEKRYLILAGKRKGNFYLLTLENSCREDLREPPPEGIGLSNIRTIVESMDGTVEKTVSEGVYKLKLLFILPQQKSSLLHQSSHGNRTSADK
ncbi:MAG: GHKL domain-containing protein [Lachnospiraceae bacterium]|nr:GHKL domain-containing protein [Lachnospiraceae bacterium]